MCCCVIETSSDLPRISSKIFGNLWKFSENLRKRLSVLRITFGETSEIYGKCSEIFGKSKKKIRHQHVYIINRILHARAWIRILSSRVELDISLVRAAVTTISCTEHELKPSGGNVLPGVNERLNVTIHLSTSIPPTLFHCGAQKRSREPRLHIISRSIRQPPS